jgi:hypothetical protein
MTASTAACGSDISAIQLSCTICCSVSPARNSAAASGAVLSNAASVAAAAAPSTVVPIVPFSPPPNIDRRLDVSAML